MLSLIKKINADRYDAEGNLKKPPELEQNSFKSFKDAPLPLPKGNKNVILLFCTNVCDGVGDFAHLKAYYQRVKDIVGDDYVVQPVLHARKQDPDNWIKHGATMPMCKPPKITPA